MIFFSIIIPTYNRYENLIRTLINLSKQSYKHFEVIIIDDSDSNLNKNYFINSINYLKLNSQIVTLETKKTVSFKRNFGVDKSKGEYLIFLDDDDSVDIYWLNDFYYQISKNSSQIVFCGVEYLTDGISTKMLFPENPYSDERGWGIFLSGTFAIRKKDFLVIGGYDERLVYGENTELGIRLKDKICTKSFINKANFVYHKSTQNIHEKNFKIYSSNLYILKKHYSWFLQKPTLYFNYLNTIAVSAFKLGKKKTARHFLYKSLKSKPFFVKNWIRLFLTFV